MPGQNGLPLAEMPFDQFPLARGDDVFKELADFAPVMIWRAGIDGLCDWFSKPWLDFTGRAMPQELGNGWAESVHPDDLERCLKVYRDAFDARRPFSMTYRLKRHDSQYRKLLDNGAAFYRQGAFAGYFGSCVDVSDLSAMEAQQRQTQKMEAIGQLTGGVAHDFNNLLTVIIGSVELLRRPNLSEATRQRHIAAISDTAQRAATLTAQLLAFSRRAALATETFDVAESIERVSSIVRALTGSRIELEIIRPDTALPVCTDHSQFDTAIVNMAVNARDAMNGEGTLTITSRAVTEIPARRGHHAVIGKFVAVSVTDIGCGITENNLARVFEPFFTTKDIGQGTGLGLSQIFSFAKQSGGDIVVDSVVGKGSTFTLYLPQVDADGMATVEPDCCDMRVEGNGLCVLVVEDNAGVGAFALGALQDLSYDGVLAASGQAALDALADDHARFQVIFSDVVMPGMSGLDLAEIVRSKYPAIPVILTTGYSDVLAQTGQRGFEMLQKPYSIEQLSRALRKAVDEQWSDRIPLS